LKLIIVSISEIHVCAISKIGETGVKQTGYGCKLALEKSIGNS
jgi:hypothetical protein